MIPDNRPPAPPPPTRLRVPLAKPFWTFVFLGINAIIFLGMTVDGGSENSDTLIRWQANFAPLVMEGEYWRLFTANFLHIGIAHILFNSYALYSLGAQAESLYGPRRFVVLYLLSGISGAVFSFAFTHGLSAGASTSLFGLFGALVAYFYKHRKDLGALGQQQLISLGLTLLINVLFGLTNPRIDNWGHAGGFIGGIILGWFFCPVYERVNPFAHAFEPVLPASRKPELSNGELMDTNSLLKQNVVVVAFTAGLIALTAVATTMLR
jgi:rhomboid protease GluP